MSRFYAGESWCFLTRTLNIIGWKLYVIVWVLWDHYDSFKMLRKAFGGFIKKDYLKEFTKVWVFKKQFSYFSTRSWEMTPTTPFSGLCYNIQFNSYAKSKVGLFVTNNIFVNVIWLLNLTLKHIDKFRLRQKSIPSGNYMFRVRKISRAMYKIYSKLKKKTPERRLVFLFLTLKKFPTLFYC